jgi:hypothetical protein
MTPCGLVLYNLRRGSMLWNKMPRSPVQVRRDFLRKMSHTNSGHKNWLSLMLTASLWFRVWAQHQDFIFLWTDGWFFSRIYYVLFHKKELYKATAAWNSDGSTWCFHLLNICKISVTLKKETESSPRKVSVRISFSTVSHPKTHLHACLWLKTRNRRRRRSIHSRCGHIGSCCEQQMSSSRTRPCKQKLLLNIKTFVFPFIHYSCDFSRNSVW